MCHGGNMNFGGINISAINPVPEMDAEDEKEVFAFFGLASFNAQCAEKALVNFVMGYKLLDESALTQDEWLVLYNNLNSKTFGQLLRHVKKRIEISQELIDALQSTLKNRNWLAHDFFYDYAIEFSDSKGRHVMICKLQELIKQFQLADRAVESLNLNIWSKFGVTKEWIQNQIASDIENYQNTESD